VNRSEVASLEFHNIILEVDDRVATVTINRPGALNALNTETLSELDTAFWEIASDAGIYAVIITGAEEKAFVAGADISEMRDMTPVEGRSFGILGNRVFRKIETLPVPVIAAVNGFALGGGCELALACDIRYASEKAKFGQPEVGLGIIPGFGGTQRLPRLVGTGNAKELLYTGKIINAAEALRIGLVNKITEPDALMTEAKTLAEAIAAQAPIAVRQTKSAVNSGLQADINSALALEAESFGLCFSTADQKEGMTAFLEKRPKTFINK